LKKYLLLATLLTLAIPSVAYASDEDDKKYLADFKTLAPKVSDFGSVLIQDINKYPQNYVITAYRLCRHLHNGMSREEIRKLQREFINDTSKSAKDTDVLASSLAILNILAPRYYCPEFKE